MHSPKGRILFAEDDPESLELIRFLFTHKGYEMVCAQSGPEALRRAKQERFDLFLLDNWMPDLSGLELTKSIREFDPSTPIIFYSAAVFEADKEAALKAGAQSYLTKPEDVEDLVAEVDRLINATRPV